MEFVSLIAVEIAKSLVSPITRRVGYLIYYNHNINNLKAEAQKLDDKKIDVMLQVDEAERNSKIIARDVIRWQKEVDDIKSKVGEFLENEIKSYNKCLNGLFPNPISLYSLGRKAAKMNLEVVTLFQEARNFSEIAYFGPPPTVGLSINTEGIMDFESRESIMNEVWDALKDDELSMISICGMGGVGKTTMVEKLVKRVEKEKLFDEVVMAVVSQNPDFKKIQGDIAAPLGFKFDEETLNGRAGKLRHRVMNLLNDGKKVLVILDDVWDNLDFGKIGLPSRSGGKGFKIVLTSREEGKCKSMGSQRNFQIEVLPDVEAWALFKEIVGDVVEHSDIKPIARKVAKECGGLPIAIATVAGTLVEDYEKDIWEAVLQDLSKSILENISGMYDKVFLRIELSYNWLRSEEAQSCFLLCCLFPEDFNIPVEYLVRYGIGLRLFKGVDNLHQARNKVSMLINKLKRSFLLLEGTVERNGYETVKMHDLVRDVAIKITKEKHSYLVNCDAKMKEWPKIVRYEHCNAISLLCENIKEHPSDLQCPKLELLQLLGHCQNLPNNFFQGIKELKVLSLNIPSLPESFGILENLQTLYLKISMWGDISILGALINLKILKIETSSLEMLPEAIGLLTNLRLLDLRDMPNLGYIPSGVLSKLSKLEEFYVTQSFMKWESMENGEKTNASLKEIETHPVTALEIWVPTILFLPEVSFLRNLKRFKIFIGGSSKKDFIKDSAKKLFLEELFVDSNASSEINVLLRETEAEALELSGVQRLKNVLCELENDGFPHLKTMSIDRCEALEYLVDAMERIPQVGFPKLEKMSLTSLRSLQALWHGEFPNSSFEEQTGGQYFSNLKDIKISNCNKLKNVFPLSMARGLTQLQSLEIERCEEIEGIFCGKKVDDDIEFPELIELKLISLPKLIGFCIEMDDPAMRPSLTSSQDVSFDSIEQQSASQMNKTTNIEHDQLRHGLSSTSRIRIRLQNLQKLELSFCDSLIVAFPFTIVGQLVQLQTLNVENCEMMEYIFAQGQEENNLVFPNLISMTLRTLPNLIAFCPDNHISFDWSSLSELELRECPKMEISCHIPSPSTLNQNIDPALNLPHSGLNDKEVMCPTPCSIFGGLKIRKGRQQKSADLNSTLQQSEQKDALYVSNNIDGQTHQIYFQAFPSKLIAPMSNLKKFIIQGSNTLEVIFSFEECHDPIQALNSLEFFHLRALPNLQHICFNIPPKISVFQNLRYLWVDYCGNLTYLFSPSVAKLLVNLRQATIIRCEKMEEIMGKEDEEANMADKIVFPQLRYLYFDNLPKLRSFYSGNYALEFPSLEAIYFNRCFKMSAFSYGPLSTPKLVTAIINDEEFGIEDLNATVKEQMFRKVRITWDETLRRIGYDQLPEDLSKLLILQVKGCKNLVNIIPCNLIVSLQNLEKLYVGYCESLKEIFEYEGVNIEEEENVVTFSHLEEIELRHLKELDHIFNKIPKSVIAFQKLRKLVVYECYSLRNIFSVHVAKGLVQLQQLQIDDCEILEEIVAKEDEEEQEASLDRIVFPKLKSLKFSWLFNLWCFYSGIYALELPLLETLEFKKCKRMKTFSYGSLTTPKLKELKINDKNHQLMEDLNATVTHLFNSKEEKLNDTEDNIDITEEGAIEEEQIKIPLDDAYER